MSVHDELNAAITTLRQKASQIRADADKAAQEFEAQATQLESKLSTVPQEVQGLAEDAWVRVKNWFAGLGL